VETKQAKVEPHALEKQTVDELRAKAKSKISVVVRL
jgi:hypothetical protein